MDINIELMDLWRLMDAQRVDKIVFLRVNMRWSCVIEYGLNKMVEGMGDTPEEALADLLAVIGKG